MAEPSLRQTATSDGRTLRSVYGQPLEMLSTPSRTGGGQILSWMIPAARPGPERDLAEFMERLVRRYEGPALIFDVAMLEQKLLALADIHARYRCHFLAPVKSFPNAVFLNLAARHLSGFDVSNLEEYRALPRDLSGKTVALAGPILRADELPRFLDRGNALVVYVDSLHQLAQIEECRSPLDYGVRVDSARLLKRRVHERGQRCRHSRFGLSGEELLAVRPRLEGSQHRFVGVLVHHASEENTAETYLALVEELQALLAGLDLSVHDINLGGGEHHLDLDSLAALACRIRKSLGEDIGLSLEPGRLLTEAAGYAVGRVENWRTRGDAVEYVLDLSMDCHLRWSKPTLIVPRPSDPGRPMRARFYGPTCHEADNLGEHHVWSNRAGEPPFLPGDLVLFGNVSGYSASIRTSFNGVAPPPVHFLNEPIGE